MFYRRIIHVLAPGGTTIFSVDNADGDAVYVIYNGLSQHPALQPLEKRCGEASLICCGRIYSWAL